MKSALAEEARLKRRQSEQAMTVEERIELALRLGRQEIADEMMRSGVSQEEAVRRISRTRSLGRRPSCANR